jgi:hypothetical protein
MARAFRKGRFHAVLGENGAYPLELQRVKARSNARHHAPKLPRIAQGRYAQIRLTRFSMMDTDLMAVSGVQVVCMQKQATAPVKK